MWHIEGFRDLRAQGDCLYGPPFAVGELSFQVQLHPDSNEWPEPGTIFVRLMAEGRENEVDKLKVEVDVNIEELAYTDSFTMKDDRHRWQGGFGPEDQGDLRRLLTGFGGETLTVQVSIQILEHVLPNSTVFRWPVRKFEEIRAVSASAEPLMDGFHGRFSRRFEVHGEKFGLLIFRADLHTNVDDTGNFYISFKLEKLNSRFDPAVSALSLDYAIVLEEIAYVKKEETLRGLGLDWNKTLGLAGKPTDCEALRTYKGQLTLRLRVAVRQCAATAHKDPSNWSEIAGRDFRYLLLSAAGPAVVGEPELLDAPPEVSAPGPPQAEAFAGACVWNLHRLRCYLLKQGVPANSVIEANYDGETEQEHPRELLERFLSDPKEASKLVVYFTGHASADDGAWCFRWLPEGQKYSSDVVVTPQDLYGWRKSFSQKALQIPIQIVVEAVGAGSWCIAAKEDQLRGHVFAACAPGCRALSLTDGSLFTSWLLGGTQALRTAQFPGGPQIPWEYTRTSTVGPMPTFRPASAISSSMPPTSPSKPVKPGSSMSMASTRAPSSRGTAGRLGSTWGSTTSTVHASLSSPLYRNAVGNIEHISPKTRRLLSAPALPTSLR